MQQDPHAMVFHLRLGMRRAACDIDASVPRNGGRLRGGDGLPPTTTPPPPLYKLRPCPSYSRRRDRINLVPNFNSVPNVVQPHKTWVW